MIDKAAALYIASKLVLEKGRGPCTVKEICHDDHTKRWTVFFRPQIPGMDDDDVIDDGPFVLVDSLTGVARLMDMMSAD